MTTTLDSESPSVFSPEIRVGGDHPRVEKFLKIVAQMKLVEWRQNISNMTSEMITLCEMIEEGLKNEKILKGNAIMYAEGGKFFRSYFKSTAMQYAKVGGMKLQLNESDSVCTRILRGLTK